MIKTLDQPRLDITRVYPVAPEKVWRAWTDPQALRRWFGPGEPDSVTSAELDVRVGGRYFPDVAARDDHRGGWLPTFEKLNDYLDKA